MNILFFVPSFLVFLYCLHKLVKDDYVFIRKNVSTEHMVDIAFMTLWIGLIFSRIFSMIFNPFTNQNVFLAFFSLHTNDFSLFSFALGSALGLYAIGKYKKLQIERLFDIFAVSFAVALPVGLLTYMISLRDYPLLIIFVNALLYGGFAYVLIKYLSPKYIFFSLVFLFFSLADSLFMQFLMHKNFISADNIIIVILFFVCIGYLIKQKVIKK